MSITIDPDGVAIKAATAKEAASLVNALNDISDRGMPHSYEEFIERYPSIGEALNDPTLSPFQKRLAALPLLKQLREEKKKIENKVESNKEKLQFFESVLKASEGFTPWKELQPRLEKNDCSRLHVLVEFLRLQDKYMQEIRRGDDPESIPWDDVSPFVVQHDWAAAFRNASDYTEGGFNLPYPSCAFEFRITGRSVTVLAFQAEGSEPLFTPYVQFGNYWVSSEDEDKKPCLDLPYARFAMEQIKAICVALDAEVATRTVMRAPSALNKKRVSDGKLPLYDYHVVSLNRKHRITNLAPGGAGHTARKRLHFRRGHWRHYEKFKTWVRWCLVGDPELGFIDKEYRL